MFVFALFLPALRRLQFALIGASLGVIPTVAWSTDAVSAEAGNAWVYSATYLSPTLYNRPMDMVAVEAARAWDLPYQFEVQIRGGVAHTMGERSDDAPYGEGRDSTTTGITGGVGLRYNMIEFRSVHIFAEAIAQFYWGQGQPFPAGGSAINGFLRAGGGVGYDISASYRIEAYYHAAHISNGGKPPHNPTWEGEGGGIAVRYRF
jgi:hypothetical protein